MLTSTPAKKTGVLLRTGPNPGNSKEGTGQLCILVKPYTIKELCGLYGVTDKVLRKWLRPFKSQIGERLGWYYTVLQVETIFNYIGFPYRIGEDER
jgi:hypothetical protein